MHNHLRMYTASITSVIAKAHWLNPSKWMYYHLLDGDLASNSCSWQWVAGSGADAAPYFRIFNPVSQGEKFDSDGSYTRKYVPEISALPDRYLFQPWNTPDNILKNAGITLGKTYPMPIVDAGFSRTRALEAFARLRAS